MCWSESKIINYLKEIDCRKLRLICYEMTTLDISDVLKKIIDLEDKFAVCYFLFPDFKKVLKENLSHKSIKKYNKKGYDIFKVYKNHANREEIFYTILDHISYCTSQYRKYQEKVLEEKVLIHLLIKNTNKIGDEKVIANEIASFLENKFIIEDILVKDYFGYEYDTSCENCETVSDYSDGDY